MRRLLLSGDEMSGRKRTSAFLAGVVVLALGGCHGHGMDTVGPQQREAEEQVGHLGAESDCQAILEWFDRDARELLAARSRLLCETDHHALREGCRRVAMEFERGVYMWSRLSPQEVARWPEVIRNLRPHSVTLDRRGCIRIEMSTMTWESLGVCYYPEHMGHLIGGHRRLLEGLWYYDDGYRPDPADHDRSIDALLRACGRL